MFINRKLSLAVATAIAASFQSTGSIAESQDVEEIFVTGIRGSLERSIDVKRDSLNMTDAISSEDIGKFPDNNIAESLQRITGVAIERNGGEGQFITVRGFGPEFNTVLVNGRTMPTDNPGREFSFDVIPSELVKGVELHKSPLAHTQEGSIGGTVNISTARPLDLDDFVLAGSIKDEYNSLSEDLSPSLSALVSHRNDDKTFGALFSVNYSKRKSQVDSLDILGWIPGTLTVLNLSDVANEDSVSTSESVFAPRNYYLSRSEETRERLSIVSSVQYKPSDRLLITVDGFYSDFDVEQDANIFQPWFPGDNFLYYETDENGTVNGFRRASQTTLDSVDDQLVNADPSPINQMPQQMDGAATHMVRPTTSNQIGINVDWQVSEELTVVADLSIGHAENNGGGKSLRVFPGIATTTDLDPQFDLRPGDDLPSYTNTGPLNDPSLYRGHWGKIVGDDIDDDIIEAKLDAKWEFEGTLASVGAGAIYSNREKEKRAIETPTEEFTCFHCGYNLMLPESLYQPFVANDLLTDFSGDIPREWLTFDPAEMLAYYGSDEAILSAVAGGFKSQEEADAYRANGGHAPKLVASNSAVVEEQVTGLYIEGLWLGDWREMPWSANLGLRYVATDVTASGTDRELESVQSQDGDDTLLTFYADMAPVKVTSSYKNVLPSVNLSLEITQDIKLKASVAQTLTRPTIADLYPALTISARENNAEMSGGNPYLEPYLSTNMDLAFEWYYSESSFAGVTLFHKDVEEWITNQTSPVAIPQYSVNQDPATDTPNQTLTFNKAQPQNQESATATGFELALVHSFDNGFGGQFNYTYVDSDAEYGGSNAGQTFALEGLSPTSYNIVGFYEQEKYGVRLAYNWRDNYLRSLSSDQGQPRHRKAYGQWDMTASYNINDKLSLFLEGVNLFDQEVREYSIYESRFLSLQQTGTRIALGIRGRF